jgi:hypothetical protein
LHFLDARRMLASRNRFHLLDELLFYAREQDAGRQARALVMIETLQQNFGIPDKLSSSGLQDFVGY